MTSTAPLANTIRSAIPGATHGPNQGAMACSGLAEVGNGEVQSVEKLWRNILAELGVRGGGSESQLTQAPAKQGPVCSGVENVDQDQNADFDPAAGSEERALEDARKLIGSCNSLVRMPKTGGGSDCRPTLPHSPKRNRGDFFDNRISEKAGPQDLTSSPDAFIVAPAPTLPVVPARASDVPADLSEFAQLHQGSTSETPVYANSGSSSANQGAPTLESDARLARAADGDSGQEKFPGMANSGGEAAQRIPSAPLVAAAKYSERANGHATPADVAAMPKSSTSSMRSTTAALDRVQDERVESPVAAQSSEAADGAVHRGATASACAAHTSESGERKSGTPREQMGLSQFSPAHSSPHSERINGVSFDLPPDRAPLTMGHEVRLANPDARDRGQVSIDMLDQNSWKTETRWIHAGERTAEAAFRDPSLGWVTVRAERNAGEILAHLIPGSERAAQVLASHLGGLNTHLADQQIQLNPVTISEDRKRGLNAEEAPGNQTGPGSGDGRGSQGSFSNEGELSNHHVSRVVSNESRAFKRQDYEPAQAPVESLFRRTTRISLVA